MPASLALQAQRTPFANLPDHSEAAFQEFGAGYFPGLLGLEVVSVEPRRVRCRVAIRRELLGPHGYLHGGALVSIADTVCGYATIANLPPGASGFLTLELKTNFLGTLRQCSLMCEAIPVHVGGTTQVWDATITDEQSGRRLAIFRCTQMVLRDQR